MLSEQQKKRIVLYSPKEHARIKAERRQADALEASRGRAEEVQERNRALPHASQFVFRCWEEPLPTE